MSNHSTYYRTRRCDVVQLVLSGVRVRVHGLLRGALPAPALRLRLRLRPRLRLRLRRSSL
eukprot:COSAG01_NODE_86_length_27623_cov_39.847224_9_plen_60_part_00